MRFMIDTHVFLWFIAGDTRLSPPVRAAIEAEENEVLMSIASVWEIGRFDSSANCRERN